MLYSNKMHKDTILYKDTPLTKFFFWLISICVVSFIFWMNITPGYFRDAGYCQVYKYLQDNDAEKIRSRLDGIMKCPSNVFYYNAVLKAVSYLDFYR